MSNWSANLKLPYLAAAQAQKHITHNEALELLDAIAQLTVIGFDTTTPPLSANDGEVWAIGAGSVNAWAGHGNKLAIWSNGGWIIVVPKPGWRAALGTDIRVFDGVAWVAPAVPDLQNLPGLGIRTGSDATNALAVAADATLFTHDGGGHQIKVNKAAAGDTASLLFQTGWSGRVEMGTAGGDDFSIKTSADGGTWQTALTAFGASGRVGFGSAVEAQAGTVTAPSYSFTSDPDTGLFRDGANAIGFAAAGQMRARVSTAGLAVTGLIGGTAVQATPVDAGAGRLMPVGAFGLGGGEAPNVADPNTIAVTGFYRVAGSANMPTSGAFVVEHMQRAAGVAVQMAWLVDAPQRLFLRHQVAAVWTGWRGYNETLGVVSQAGGVATGAVIERGTNANGDYTRFADGTQICSHRLTGVAISTAVASGLYRSAALSWTLPAAFVLGTTNGATVHGRVAHADGMSVNIADAACTTAVAGIRAYGVASIATAAVHLHAIGRWI